MIDFFCYNSLTKTIKTKSLKSENKIVTSYQTWTRIPYL